MNIDINMITCIHRITEIIDKPPRIQELFISLIKSAKSEILLILPTINAFMREHRIGVMHLFKELSSLPGF